MAGSEVISWGCEPGEEAALSSTGIAPLGGRDEGD
jgi:hypothetical protein